MSAPISITVFSDFVCPWCYIGHQRLINAAAGVDRPINLHFKPYLLNPQLPPEGIPRQQYVQQKFGAQAESFYARITQVAAEDGLHLRFDRIVYQPQTFDLHRLVSATQTARPEIADALVLRLFRGFLIDGDNLSDINTIAALYTDIGGEADTAYAILNGDAERDPVQQSLALAQQYGVTGVPLFVIHASDNNPENDRIIPGAIEQGAWEKLLQ